jgi:hypothetical protein
MAAPRLDRTDALLLAWTLGTKVAVLALGLAALWLATGSPPGLFDPWDRWDAPHYTDIAVFGYMADDPGTLVPPPGYAQVFPGDLDLYIVFFPLFPWLVGAVNAVIGAPVAAAFVVATVASLFVAPMLYRLVAVDLGPRVGLWSAGLLLVFPTAYFLHIGYTESLFLALSFASLWLARTNRWWAAGIVGGLAALTTDRTGSSSSPPWRSRRGSSGARTGASRSHGWGRSAGVAIGFADLPGAQPGGLRRPVRVQRDPALALVQAAVAAVGRHRRDDRWTARPMPTTRSCSAGWSCCSRGSAWRRRCSRALAAADVGGLDGRQLAADRQHRLRHERAALQPGAVRDHGLGRDRRGALAPVGWLLVAGSATAMAWFAWRFAVGLWAF